MFQQDGIIHPRGNVRRVELQGLAVGLGRAGPIHAGPEVAAQQVVGERAGQIRISGRRVRRKLDGPAGLGPGRFAQPGLQQQPRVMRVLVGAVGVAGQLRAGLGQGLGNAAGRHVTRSHVFQPDLHFPRRILVLGQFGDRLPQLVRPLRP